MDICDEGELSEIKTVFQFSRSKFMKIIHITFNKHITYIGMWLCNIVTEFIEYSNNALGSFLIKNSFDKYVKLSFEFISR